MPQPLALALANKQGNLTSHQAYDGELVAYKLRIYALLRCHLTNHSIEFEIRKKTAA